MWIRAAARSDGHKYCEMLFVYVDDILAVSHKAKEVIEEVTAFYKAKEGSIKEPDIYLGANIENDPHVELYVPSTAVRRFVQGS